LNGHDVLPVGDLGLDVQDLRRRRAEIAAFSSSLSESRRRLVHRMVLPAIGIVAAQHDLADPDLRREMADGFGVKISESK